MSGEEETYKSVCEPGAMHIIAKAIGVLHNARERFYDIL